MGIVYKNIQSTILSLMMSPASVSGVAWCLQCLLCPWCLQCVWCLNIVSPVFLVSLVSGVFTVSDPMSLVSSVSLASQVSLVERDSVFGGSSIPCVSSVSAWGPWYSVSLLSINLLSLASPLSASYIAINSD